MAIVMYIKILNFVKFEVDELTAIKVELAKKAEK